MKVTFVIFTYSVIKYMFNTFPPQASSAFPGRAERWE